MLSYTVYKVVHYVGVFTAVTALAAFFAHIAVGGPPLARVPWARRLAMAHGVGLFLVLLGGFGMLARLDVTVGLALPGWIWAKVAIWAGLGAGIALGRRRPEFAGLLIIAVPVLAVLAGTIALTKPF